MKYMWFKIGRWTKYLTMDEMYRWTWYRKDIPMYDMFFFISNWVPKHHSQHSIGQYYVPSIVCCPNFEDSSWSLDIWNSKSCLYMKQRNATNWICSYPTCSICVRARKVKSKCLDPPGKQRRRTPKALSMASMIIEYQRRWLDWILCKEWRSSPTCHSYYCYDDQLSSVQLC